MGNRGDRRRDRHLDLSADQFVEHRPRALVGDMLDARAGHRLEQLHRQGGRVRTRTVIERVRARAGERHQVLHRLRRYRRVHDQQQLLVGGMHDGREVAQRVVGQLASERGVDRVAGGHQQQRVAVGLRARDQLAADDAVDRGAVVDHERLRGRFRQPLGDHASDQVGAAGRRVGHDQAHRTVRVGEARPGACEPQRDQHDRARAKPAGRPGGADRSTGPRHDATGISIHRRTPARLR